jgi:hypothetical protein
MLQLTYMDLLVEEYLEIVFSKSQTSYYNHSPSSHQSSFPVFLL